MYYETYKPMLKNGFNYQAFAQKDVVLPGFDIPLLPLNKTFEKLIKKMSYRINCGIFVFHLIDYQQVIATAKMVTVTITVVL